MPVVSASAGSLGIDIADPTLEASILATLGDVETTLHRCRAQRAPADRGGVACTWSTPAASGSGRCWWRSPPSSATRPAPEVRRGRDRGRADPPGHALPRRRHGRGGRAPRRAVGQLPLDATRSRSWSATTCSPGPRASPPTSATEAVRIQAETFSRLVHGQIAETVGPRDGDDPVEHYLQRHRREDRFADRHVGPVRRACSAAPTPAQVEALAHYGETIGIAFQLSDDLLDIASESTQSGKTPGTDLREGVPTLPVLYALASDDADPGLDPAAGDPGRRPGHRRRPARRGAAAAARVERVQAGARDRPLLRRDRARRSSSALPDGSAAPRPRVALRLHRRPHELSRPQRGSTAPLAHGVRSAASVQSIVAPSRQTGDLGIIRTDSASADTDVGKRAGISYGESPTLGLSRRRHRRHCA